VIGAEALLRWQNPELGAVPPATFIPPAEDTGLIITIGAWVLRTACRQNSQWQKAGLPPLTMAVNLSPRQFWNPGLIGSVTQILQETGLDPSYLELEIIESMVMRDINSAVSMLKELKRTLRSESYRILSATSAGEGFNQLALNQVDVILCDQKMPGMTGFEFLTRVKDLYPGTVRIAMSGYADAGMVADAINQSGIYKFLIKPINSDSLRETLEEAFALSM
jgi:CheY-like chemotaxis protein